KTEIALQKVMGLEKVGNYTAAIEVWRQAIEEENNPGEGRPRMVGMLGELYFKAGEVEKAIAELERCIAMSEEMKGAAEAESREILSTTLEWLGWVHMSTRHYKEAASVYQRLLDIYELHAGPDDIAVAKARNNLAHVYFQQREYGSAEGLLLRSVSGFEKVL